LRNLTETRTWDMLHWAYKDKLTCCPTNSLPISHQQALAIKRCKLFYSSLQDKHVPILSPRHSFPCCDLERKY
jgi:hypothetical protein